MSPAKRRRAYGSGGIIQEHTKTCPPVDPDTGTRPDHRCDGLWRGRIYTGRFTAKGTREEKVIRRKSKAKLEGEMRKLTRELADHGPAALAASSRTTVKMWADTWLPRHAETARPNYYTTDAGHVHKWIIPTLGHIRLSQLTTGDVRALRAAVTRPDPPRYPNGRSTTTAHAVQGVLVRMLKAAREEKHVIDPAILTMKKPKKAVNDRTAMTVPELGKVLDVIRARPDRSRWLAAILTGTRQGETLGLTWECIDLDARTIDVSWQIQPLPYKVARDRSSGFRVPDGFEARHLVGALHLTRPKTSKGQRLIPVVPFLGAALDEARDRWTPNPWDLVWTDTLLTGEPRPIRDDADRARWHEIQAEAGVAHPNGRPYHVHETRHSLVSLLLAAGVDRAVIAAIVGQAVLLDVYAHMDLTTRAAALGGFADRLQLGG